jgi:hypothetical protein
MKIAIIDADLVGRKVHRFPNLACMKFSGYYKDLGYDVELKLDYKNLDSYDYVKISRVYTDTPTPEWVLELPNVEYGGTGFFFDKSPDLPDEIEHHRPDYTLYIEWANKEIARGLNPLQFDDYFNASVGFLTRGCFRKCAFCVNRKYDHCSIHSPLSEFLDMSRRFIVLADDNFLSYPFWGKLLTELEETKKPFIFTQGLDIRLLTEHTAERFSKVKYRGDFIFAFDHLEDRELIESKLTIWRKYVSKHTKLYVFSGFDYNDKYDEEFWANDIASVFERAKILMKYDTTPYIMRYFKYNESPYRGMYITLCRWCNQPPLFKRKSFRQFCTDTYNTGKEKAIYEYMLEFERNHPDIAAKYFDIRFQDINEQPVKEPKKIGPRSKLYKKE